MLIAVADGALCELAPDGTPAGPVRPVTEFAAEVRAHPDARWVLASTETLYPELLRAGVRLARCHDLELTEALLLGHEGRWGEPRSVAAAHARLAGAPVPPDPPARQADAPGDAQATLFAEQAPSVGIHEVIAVHAEQLRRMAAAEQPGRFRLLVAAESASGLVAVEMGEVGLPWHAATHDELLTGLLGERPAAGGPPRKLVALTEQITSLLGAPGLHPDSPAEVRRALRRIGIDVPNTRAWTLRKIEHPVIPVLIEYKELYRIWTTHAWGWRSQWVRDGRFHPAYIPGGVVSGRWATRGGGALQIPAVLRGAVRAEPGWRLVVADAGQLEPRILAAVSRDPGLCKAAGSGDLYEALAKESFKDRASAKLALLGAMYGQTGGSAAPALAVLRGRYPLAWEVVEEAARQGEYGGLVRSWLGRTCPPTSAHFDFGAGEGGEGAKPDASARARGRFTRNFVIQATAAEWAATLLALVRQELWDIPAELVFFQHDEVIVHCPEEFAERVAQVVTAAAVRTGRVLFGDATVHFPLQARIVESYAEAK
ncbi:DNA polymerase-1 [Allocatelliglobosispora scoriae]|uniref:DNA-directed DNA polymerase n=1 Tax=Allocatelliglobosispora scoriae TaxID=643052 RepID=A0A841BQT3_9ACTN|nr:bifunctional 3'-5' exonuclease/DNA polymerase [Allocatelliglobosispora scoriae]MBB5869181.1 DNA polymerase-1 [Allocatelliglobosispora scoriae]